MRFEVLRGKKREEILGYLQEEFGVDPEFFSDYCLLRSGNRIWLASRDICEKGRPESFPAEAVGLSFLRVGKGLKLTTSGAQFLGSRIKKRIMDVGEDELARLLSGLDLRGEGEGYVVFRFRGDVIGIGRFVDGRVKNMIPKSRRIPLKELSG